MLHDFLRGWYTLEKKKKPKPQKESASVLYGMETYGFNKILKLMPKSNLLHIFHVNKGFSLWGEKMRRGTYFFLFFFPFIFGKCESSVSRNHWAQQVSLSLEK